MAGGLAKVYRLQAKHDFTEVFAAGTKLISGRWVLRYNANASLTPRLGVIVGKRYVPSACVRNYLRRVVRWSFSYRTSNFAGVDIVVILSRKYSAHSSMRNSNSKYLQQELNELWDACCRALSLPC